MSLIALALALLATGTPAEQCEDKKPAVPPAAVFAAEGSLKPPAPAPEPPDPDPFGFGTYRGLRAEPMQDAVINGARFQIASLILKEPPDVVIQTYRAQLKQAGITPIEGAPPEGHGMRYLSFHPENSRRLRTLTVIPQGGGTVVLVSVGDPRPMLEQPKDANVDLPIPPGAGQLITTSFGIVKPDERHAFFEVDGLSPSAVVAFYVEEMPKRGFKRLTEQPKVGARIFFKRPGDLWTVAVTEGPSVGTSRVELMRLLEDAP